MTMTLSPVRFGAVAKDAQATWNGLVDVLATADYTDRTSYEAAEKEKLRQLVATLPDAEIIKNMEGLAKSSADGKYTTDDGLQICDVLNIFEDGLANNLKGGRKELDRSDAFPTQLEIRGFAVRVQTVMKQVREAENYTLKSNSPLLYELQDSSDYISRNLGGDADEGRKKFQAAKQDPAVHTPQQLKYY